MVERGQRKGKSGILLFADLEKGAVTKGIRGGGLNDRGIGFAGRGYLCP